MTYKLSGDIFPEPRFPLRASLMRTQGAMSAHGHEFVEIVVVTGGGGLHWGESGGGRVERGDALIIPEGCQHAYVEVEELSLWNLMFIPRRLSIPLFDLAATNLHQAVFGKGEGIAQLRLTPEETGEMESIMLDLEKACANGRGGWRFAAMAALTRSLAIIAGKMERTVDGSDDAERRLAPLLDYLHANYRQKISLEKMAALSKMSNSCLLRHFRRATGRSPADYLTRLRVEKSREFLTNPDVPVAEAAYAVGIPDTNYFSRQFRLVAGETPSEFRRRVLNLNPSPRKARVSAL